MGVDMLERDDLSVYVVAGVPKSFKRKLQAFVAEESKDGGGVMLIEDSLADWLIAKLADEKRPSSKRTPASRALWRAFSALSAARYHLQHSEEEEERVRELRSRVEELWRETSPMFPEEGPTAGTGDDDE
jgi:hypothetical protein